MENSSILLETDLILNKKNKFLGKWNMVHILINIMMFTLTKSIDFLYSIGLNSKFAFKSNKNLSANIKNQN